MTIDELAVILRAGLHWLYDTEQPDGALLQHHGTSLCTDANRLIRFCPVGAHNLPVITVDAPNPLMPGELDGLAATITTLGVDVAGTWNGHPGTTGSVGLKRRAHPSLIAAVGLYRAGCPDHPSARVFCECGWYRAGRALVVEPTVEMGVAR